MNKSVLITGARSAVALDLARDFHHAGYNVHMADCSSAFMAKWSRIPFAIHHYASPVHQQKQFAVDIEHLTKTIMPEMIIPTCEEVFHLAHPSLKATLQERLFAPPLSILRSLHAKDCFIELCKESGINAPETHLLESRNQLNDYYLHAGDWVFKPCFSRFGSHTLVSPTPEQLAGISPDIRHPWVAQRRIYGQEFSFYAIAKKGKLVAFAPYSSAWRLQGGASYVFSTIPEVLFQQIYLIAQRMAEKMALDGQFSCDLICDEEGEIWPIECNPRATSGLHLLTGNGQLANAIMHDVPAFPATVSSHYMLPMMLTHGFCRAFKRGNWHEWQKTLRYGNDVISHTKDRLPLMGAILDTIMFAITGKRQGISLTQATTYDIEWNGNMDL